jgi:hypothetical protein
MALTDLTSAKLYLRITGSAEDTLLTALIAAASSRIERWCGRKFDAANYWEWIRPGGEDRATLAQSPVISLDRVVTGFLDCLSFRYTGSAVRAVVSVVAGSQETAANLRLQSTAASGVHTTSALALATYPSLSTLATAADAVADWTVAVVGDDASAYDLHPIAGQDAKTGELRLARAYDYVEAGVDYDAGIVTIPAGIDLALCEYRAGYATIPDDLEQVANEFIQDMWNAGKVSTAVQSESLPDYSYTLADRVQLTDRQKAILAPYRRWR